MRLRGELLGASQEELAAIRELGRVARESQVPASTQEITQLQAGAILQTAGVELFDSNISEIEAVRKLGLCPVAQVVEIPQEN